MRFAHKRLDHANAGERLLHGHHHFAHAFLFASHSLSGATPVNAERQQAGRKKDQGDYGELPIHQEQNADCADDRYRLLEDIAANSGQRHLHDARIICDS